MPSDPASIRRCQHIKVNGTQCGSPAVREQDYCYFHGRWRRKGMYKYDYYDEQMEILTEASLEDANSIQVALAEVMRRLMRHVMDHKTAGLLLYALQIASANVKSTSFEPEQPAQVVVDQVVIDQVVTDTDIDSECVARHALESSASSKVEGREYTLTEGDLSPKKEAKKIGGPEKV